MEEYEYERRLNEKKKEKFESMVQFLVLFLLVIAISFFVKKFIVQRAIVDGSSMNRTLSNGDSVMVEKLSYTFGEIERFDIVVFPFKEESGKEVRYIKRIIGLPNEEVLIDNGKIYIDGVELEEDFGYYTDDEVMQGYDAVEGIICGDDEYFVLGDNRNNSLDSRKIGCIKKEKIVGKAFFRLFPFSEMGILE